jgi:phosphomethylpyrimidine synthase
MKITQDVRDYSARLEAEAGMQAKSAEFKAHGGELYIPVQSA